MSSIIVKGMEMPENCGTCFIGNRTICTNGCPLVALPDKHGRLVEFIDVDEVLDEDSGTTEVCLGDVFRAYLEMRNAPTIVEAEDSE